MANRMKSCRCILAVLLLFTAGFPGPMVHAETRGPVTNLPLPRYVSLKGNEGNVRRGPSMLQRVDWMFKHRNMPLQVIDEYENWRRIRDVDGAEGWMHHTLLSGRRTVIVQKDYTPLRSLPEIGAAPNAYAEQGVIAFLVSCTYDWCKIRAEGQKGWILKTEVWGVDPEEVN